MLTTNSSLMDGINRHILVVASALNLQEGLEVAVCTVMPAGELNAALERQGVRTFSLEAPNGHDWRILRSFRWLLRSFRPDIVHIHVLAVMERVVLATCFRRLKYVTTVHGISDKVAHITARMRAERLLNAIFSIPLSARCYISNGVREALADTVPGPVRSEVIYNPLPFGPVPDRGSRLRQMIGVDAGTPVIGTSCRIAAVKNPVAFTEVMCRAMSEIPAVQAVVMGDGAEDIKTDCRAIVNRYGMTSRFHWLGYRNDAPELVQELDCFVMTSVSEGLPTSLLECMSLKTPIAFLKGQGGLRDLAQFDQEEGPMAVTANEGDLEGLAAGIVNLLRRPELAKEYAGRAYEVGKRHFDVSSVTKQLAELYKSL